ncbi:Disease resistance protein RPM1 [Acorus gramineus]|uniref:Disease resistance protein RPM1 n=1 Tax=Acorus gramineus TaxID=55184 RepID=A0AAV9B9R0_ACOGR|nr:Disease resistance protein RPM1 [Acorus gramineus]
MAEAIVGLVILKLGSALVTEFSKSLLLFSKEEASLLLALRSDMEEIKSEMEMIQAFIRHADMTMAGDERTAVWVAQVREIAYYIEDIIDDFTYSVGEQKSFGFWKSVAKPLQVSMNFKGIAMQLQNIKIRIKGTSERRIRYDIKGLEEGSSSKDVIERSIDISPFHKEDDDIVGLKSKKEQLINWLKDDRAKHMEISVCGMGGVGKTTLVAKVYKSEQIVQHFQWRAWVTVSKSYNKNDILRSIIKELFHEKKEMIPQGIDGMNTKELAENLHGCLVDQRYLIVLDDVWDVSLWSEIKDVFNTSKRRIMFTTRNSEIATSLASSSDRVFNLKPLQDDEARKLFCNIAFRGDRGGICPTELECPAKEIINKCDGLPLAIVTLGGLLRTKHSAMEWNDTLKSLNWMLTNSPQLEKMSNILMLSFHDLPHYLKNCFLYCSAFPEDYRIKRKRIIRLWVAEGFIEERDGMTMEEIAEQYLNQLILKNMLFDDERNVWGRLKLCKMHDIVREVAISISKKQKFCMTLEEQPTTGVRRISVAEVNDTIQEELGKMSRLRSLLVFATNFFNIKTSLGFKLLRVLDLQDALIDSIPDEVGDLFNLRFLGLSNTKVKVLPKRLKRLQNLQTLDLAYSNVEKIPNGVTKLPNLRHVFLPKHVWVSKELQTLQGISSSNEVVRQVGDLTQLRSFAIVDVRESEGTKLCASIKKMKFLHHLQIQATDTPLILETLDPPPPLLQRLYLGGRLQGTLPRWFKSLTNLKMLYLKSSGLNEDPLLSLKSLPNLVEITLDNAYDGEELCFQADGFPSLKELWLVELSHLNQITIEEGAMQSLKEFNLVSCKELKTLPQDIERLTTLQELNLWEMAEELLERMRGGQAVDRQKISHIPIVKHVARIDGRWKTEMFS